MFASTRPAVCSVSLDLSLVNGASQNVITDATTAKTFTATPSSECGSSSIEYQVTYTPASTTVNLITLPTATVASISFAQSTNINDAQQYTLTVKAKPVGSGSWTAPSGTATVIYTYVDLCATTTLNPPSLIAMTTAVLK